MFQAKKNDENKKKNEAKSNWAIECESNCLHLMELQSVLWCWNEIILNSIVNYSVRMVRIEGNQKNTWRERVSIKRHTTQRCEQIDARSPNMRECKWDRQISSIFNHSNEIVERTMISYNLPLPSLFHFIVRTRSIRLFFKCVWNCCYIKKWLRLSKIYSMNLSAWTFYEAIRY